MTRTCTRCHAPLSAGAKFCTACGQVVASGQAATEGHSPQLEIFDFRPWFPAGCHTAFGIRLRDGGCFSRARIHVEGPLAGSDERKLELDLKPGGMFEGRFGCLSPAEGGGILTHFRVECSDPAGSFHHYRGDTTIPLIANHWQEDVIRKNLQGVILELRNQGGLLRLENGISGTTSIDRLVVDNEDGITRLKGDIESGGVLSWLVPLSFVESTAPTETECCDSASLMFLAGGQVGITRVFARERISLGRPMLSADLWLSLLPLTDPQNHLTMDRMSREHAWIRRNGDGFQIRDGSTWGTWLNGERLDGEWHGLSHGDLIGFQHPTALTLRVHLLEGGALRLERVGNGAAEEDYLLLPEGSGPTDRPGLSHRKGVFVLQPGKGDTRVNNRRVEPSAVVGLKDGDLVERGDMRFLFSGSAYPVTHTC